MIRVMLTGPSFNDSVGGIAVHVRNLVELFNGNQTVEIDHFAITAAKYNRETWAKKIHRLTTIILPYVLRLKRCDLLHLNSTFDNRSVIRDLFYGAIAIFVNRPNIIIQFHGGEPVNVIFFKIPIFYPIFKWLFGGKRQVLVLSEFQKKQFQHYFPTIDVTLVPNCIRLSQQQKKKVKDNRRTNFLFMGRISETKGILKILEAAKQLMETSEDFVVTICGKGPLQEKLLEEIKSNNMQQHIKYLGFVNGSRKTEVLQDSDVMLLPTDHNEGFPYALLEAFDHQIPVIGTRKGAIPEVLEDGVNGFIIDTRSATDLFEKMKFFCHNPDNAALMGSYGREKLNQKYTSDILLKKLMTIYSGSR